MIATEPCAWPAVELTGFAGVLPARDVPGAVLDNALLSRRMAEGARMLADRGYAHEVPLSSPEFPLERLGIRSRRVLDADWINRRQAIEAARRALEASGVPAREVRCVIVSTVTPEATFPALAASVHDALGLPPTAEAFDLALGCSGSLVALGVAARRLLGEPPGAAALVVGAEALSRLCDASDRTTCTVFGDAAGAFVVRRTEERRLAPVRTWTDGSQEDRIRCLPADPDVPLLRFRARDGETTVEEERIDRRRIGLEGRRVFRDMVRALPEAIGALLEREGSCLADIDRFVFHQANLRMLEAVAQAMGIDGGSGRMPTNIAEVGNVASASIPLLLSELARTGEVTSGERLLLVGFGAGYSIAAATLVWP